MIPDNDAYIPACANADRFDFIGCQVQNNFSDWSANARDFWLTDLKEAPGREVAFLSTFGGIEEASCASQTRICLFIRKHYS